MSERKIDLSGLPRKIYHDREIIDWINSIGYKCKFVYDDIHGEVEITDYDGYQVTVERNGVVDNIKTYHFENCLLGKIAGKRTIEFKVDIRTIFKDEKRDIIITEREYRSKTNINNRTTTKKYYKYKCNKCGYNQGWVEESSLLKQESGCPCCCNPSRLVVKGINDIATTDPWMLKYLANKEDAYKYTSGSHKKICAICPDCGRIKDKPIKIYEIYKNDSIGCICGDSISYPEKFMYNILKSINIDFEWQLSKSSFDWCDNYKYDFYDKNLNMIIETHGGQHYKKNTNFKMKLEDVKINDVYKKELALNNGVNKYITIDCRESDFDWIKNSILNSELAKIYDLSNIDWDNINELSLRNLVKVICEFYENNEHLNQKEIANIFKLSQNTTRKYLKQGEKLGWCSNVKQRGEDAKIKASKESKYKKVICIELNEEFKSMSECANSLSKRFNKNFSMSKLSNVCNGKRNTHQGFHFKYI